MKIVFATSNSNKLKEIQNLLPSSIELINLRDIDCSEEIPETSDTIEGNALQKANYILENYNLPCFADDTGLEVESLNGAPGVYSARYAGPERDNQKNITKLLKELSVKNNRTAQFKTVIALVGLTDQPILFEGICTGQITETLTGANGFGYDPIFKPKNNNKTFAQMTLEEKNEISHRGLATKKLINFLSKI